MIHEEIMGVLYLFEKCYEEDLITLVSDYLQIDEKWVIKTINKLEENGDIYQYCGTYQISPNVLERSEKKWCLEEIA